MNKKLIAILSISGIVATLTGCSAAKVENFKENINEFKQYINEYAKINTEKANKTIFNKYKLAVSAPIDATLVNGESATNDSSNEETSVNEQNVNPQLEDGEKLETDKESTPNISTLELKNSNVKIEKLSTLYSLTDDINGECEDFCNLKESLTNAIIETQNLINKINSKEVTLTAEQRMLITEQSRQLKDLGRQLSHVTTELSINMSDLANLMRENGDLDNINLKYLVVLDNLVNGNEMLENGLRSLNLINNMFNFSKILPPNNTGRVLYGYKKNNEPPVVRDYLIDKNGSIKENTEQVENVKETETKETADNAEGGFKTNIDSYRSNRSNIDSFFNTALLDNEFMYGNNGYGYGNGLGMGGGFNPYLENQYADSQENQAINNTNSVNNANNTQNIDTNTKQTKTKKKGLQKNVDTYKDENAPNLSAKFNKIKQSINNFFSKLKPKNKLKQPFYMSDENEKN